MTERKTDTGAESVAAPLRHYAFFKDYIVTANADGSIPINAKIAAHVVQAFPMLNNLIYQANSANSLLVAAQIAYTILGDIRHEWDGRNTPEGQGALIAMRDAIAKATGRDAESVQNEYSSKARG